MSGLPPAPDINVAMRKVSCFSRCRLISVALALTTGLLPLPGQPAPENRNSTASNPRRTLAPDGRFEGGLRAGPGMGIQYFPLIERVLTTEQRESLRTAMNAQRESLRAIDGKLREARRELMKASMIDEFSEDAVRAKAVAVGKLEAEVTVLRARAFAEMVPPLSEEQVQQLQTPSRWERGEGRPGIPPRVNRNTNDRRERSDLPHRPK